MNTIDEKILGLIVTLVIVTVAGTVICWKVVDSITDDIAQGNNRNALKKAGTAWLILMLAVATTAIAWFGYHRLFKPDAMAATSPTASPAPPSPNPPIGSKYSQRHGRGSRSHSNNPPACRPRAAQTPQTASLPNAARGAQSKLPSAPAAMPGVSPPAAPASQPLVVPVSQPACTAAPSPAVDFSLPSEKKPEFDRIM
jgi:hypothetical protein